MRLRPDEQRALRDYFTAKLPRGASARLFGSRVDDSARGGDIDVCIVAVAEVAANLRRELHRMRAELRALLGDQRVDVSVVEESVAAADPFWCRALVQSVALN